MDRATLISRLPRPYAQALRLHDRGLDDAISDRLGIEREAVAPLIALAEAKLARLEAADGFAASRKELGGSSG